MQVLNALLILLGTVAGFILLAVSAQTRCPACPSVWHVGAMPGGAILAGAQPPATPVHAPDPGSRGYPTGECVLELGPGPGAFTVDAARRVGSEGSIIAVDIQPEMIAQVEERVREANLSNVETHVASAYELPLENESVDRAFLVTVLPEIPDQNRALAELRRVLKPGGRLSITEEFMDPDYPFPAETIRRVEAVGFELEQRFGNFWVYTASFRRKP